MDFVYGTSEGAKVYMYTHCTTPNDGRFPALSRGCATCSVASVRASHTDQCIECPQNQMRDGSGVCASCPPGNDRNVCVPGSKPLPLLIAAFADSHASLRPSLAAW